VSKRCKYCKKIIGICNYPIHDDCKDAYEQGKLAGIELAMGMVRLASGKEIRSSEASEAVQTYRELLFERLKSQLKEVKKDV